MRVYYNLGDALENGYDIDREIRQLGRERICQVHCKEGEVRLGDGAIDFPRVKESLDAIDWRGWLVIERSRLPGRSVKENFSANARYLKSSSGRTDPPGGPPTDTPGRSCILSLPAFGPLLRGELQVVTLRREVIVHPALVSAEDRGLLLRGAGIGRPVPRLPEDVEDRPASVRP